MTTPPTKCLSKMNKKELYEYCKILGKENQKLQLFNNSQEEENALEIEELKKEIEELKAQVGIHTEKYGGTMVFPSVYYNKKQKCKERKLEIKQLELKYEIDIKQKDIYIEKYQLDIEELKKDLEYFQNKCEIMEKELIKKEED